MVKGQVLTFPLSEYFNCKSSVERLNDAYAGARQWSRKKRTTVTRIR